MIPLTVINTNFSDDVFVVLIDVNAGNAPIIFNKPANRLNVGQQFLIQAQEDGEGEASLTWTATNAKAPEVQKAGQGQFSTNEEVQIDTFGA